MMEGMKKSERPNGDYSALGHLGFSDLDLPLGRWVFRHQDF
jgi:hypothetical protein